MYKIGTKMTEVQEKALETALSYDTDHAREVNDMPDNPYDCTAKEAARVVAQKIALDEYHKEATKARRDAIAECADILAAAFYEYHDLYASYVDNFIYGLLDELKRETQMRVYELQDDAESDE